MKKVQDEDYAVNPACKGGYSAQKATEGRQHQELKEFVSALEEKIVLAGHLGKDGVVEVLNAIKQDMQKWLLQFERSSLSFDEAYEEVTSLYVFTEMYIKLGTPSAP